MSQPSAQHSTFTIDRLYDASPARVFDAWAKPEAKEKWFAGPDGVKTSIREHDFRIGGEERVRGEWPGGKSSDFRARYFDIVDGKRIVYAYDMFVNDVKISVSLATVDLRAEGKGTRMIFTEQCAFLDGYDDGGSRERGTSWALDKLGSSLK
jgi:uncharacterized protein YndB with AHSA1/START domain